MYCFRRHGHNESDEPSFTQPLLYRKIAAHPLVSAIYTEQLVAEGSDHRGPGRRRSTRSTRPRWRRTSQRRRRARRPRRHGAPSRATPSRDPPPSSSPRTAIPRCDGRRGRSHRPDRARRSRRCPTRFKANPKIKRLARRPRAGAPGRGPGGLGVRRGARLRFAPHRGIAGPPERPGLRARDLQPPPRGAGRHRDGREVHAAARLDAKQARFCVYNSPALRGRRPGLRLRLLARLSRHALPLGGAVRRLRQRRPGRHRPVHRQRRVEVAAHQRASSCFCPTATRARAPSTRRRGSSASCRPAPRTTSRSPISRRPPSISTSCAAR